MSEKPKEREVIRYNQASEAGALKAKWWNAPEDEMHKHVFAVVQRIRQKQSYRSTANLRFARLYANQDIAALQAGLHARVEDPAKASRNRLSLNVGKACVDTAASKIGAKKTRPMFLTNDGDWLAQRRAELLTEFMEGAFDSMGTGQGDQRTLYGIGRRAFVDGCVLGLGPVKFYPDKIENLVKAERVLAEEIVVDEVEGMYETPRQLHQEKLVYREVLVDLFPKYEAEIMQAQSGLPPDAQGSGEADMIKVIESWHLPSGKEAGDGRKCLAIQNCTLDVSDWDKDYFPFLFKRWQPRLVGFYGQGLIEELMPIQLEINKLIRTIAIAQHLVSAPQVWLEMQNKVNSKQLDNEIGGVKYYTGSAPVFTVPQAMSSEVYQHLENLYRKAFEITGISMLSAASKKPSGIDSAVALREYQDIESERFQMAAQRDQDFYIDAAYMVMDMMNDLDNPTVKVQGKQGIKEISWKQAKMDKDKLRIRAYPTDILPSQPAGKLQKVQELMQAGFFDKEESLELLDFPDVRRVTRLKTSGRENISRLIEQIIEKGVYETPEPYIHLPTARNLAQAHYNMGKCDGMPEDRLDLLRRFMDDCQAMIEQTAQPQQPEGAPAMAQPEAAPTSDLLPLAQ